MEKENQPKQQRIIKPAPYRASYSNGKVRTISREKGNNKDLELLGSLESDFRVREVYMAVCRRCHVYLSPCYRDTEAEADGDAAPHYAQTRHSIGIEKTYIR